MKEVLGIELVCDDKNFTVNLKRGDIALRQLNKSLVRTVDATRHAESGFSRAARSFRHMSTTVAALRYTIGDLADLFVRLPASVLNTYGKFERLQKLMEGMSTQTGAAERIKEAGDNVKYLIEMSKRAPFTIDALSDAFVKFKTGGVDPLNGSLQALVDANARFGGTSETLKRAAVAVQQMGGKGVISMEELRQQLGEAVPSAMRNMAQGVGVTMAVLQKKIADGAVESQEAMQRMFTVMRFQNEGASENLMKTWNGTISRLSTSWDLLVNDLGKSGFAQETQKQLKDLTAFLDSSEAKQFAADLSNALATLVHTLAESAKWLAKNIDLIKSLSLAYGVLKIGAGAGRRISNFGATFFGTTVSQAAKEANDIAEARKKSIREVVQEKVRERQQIHNLSILAAQDRHKAALAELAENKAVLDQKLAQHNAMNRKIAEQQARYNFLRNTGRYGGRGAVANSAVDPAFIAGRNLAAMQAEQRALNSQIAVVRRAETAQQKLVKSTMLNVGQQQKLAKANRLATGAIYAKTAAMRAGGAVLNLMGGWLGLVTTALMLGVLAWNKWGNAGEKAIKLVKDAINSGTANSATVRELDDIMAEKEKERAEAVRQKNALLASPGAIKLLNSDKVTDFYQRRELEEKLRGADKRIDDAEKAIVKMASLRENARELAKQNDANDAVEKQRRDLDQTFRGISSEENARVNEIFKKRDERINALIEGGAKGYKDAIKKAQVEAAKQANAVILDSSKKQLAVAQEEQRVREQQYNTLKESGKATEEQLNIAKGLLDNARATVRDRRGFVEQATQLQTGMDLSGGKPPKKKPKTDAQKRAERIAAVQQRVDNLREQFEQSGENLFDQLADPEVASLAGSNIERLRKQILRLDEAMVKAGGAAGDVKKQTADLVSSAALRDLAEMALNMRDATREIQVGLLPTEAQRVQAEYDHEMKLMNAKYVALMREVAGRTDAAEKIKAIEDAKAKYVLARNEQLARDLETPIQAMAREWREQFNVGVDNMMRDWAEDSIDAIAEFTETGKFKWREMVSSWLKDLNRLVLQKTFSGIADDLFDGAGGAIKRLMNNAASIFGFGGGNNSGGAPGIPGMLGIQAINPNSALLSDGAGGVVKLFNSLAPSLKNLDGAVGDLATDGIAQMTKKTVDAAVQTSINKVTEQTAAQTFAVSLGEVTLAAKSAAVALASLAGGSSGGGGILGKLASSFIGSFAGQGTVGTDMSAFANTTASFAFAKGGIMTSLGPMALRKYANGGIARTPQAAIFAEGSHPEAFVPLPDGRSIPVTLKGGADGGDSVVININVTNNGSNSKSTMSTSDEKSSYNALAKQIRPMVLKVIAEQKAPGGVLAKR